VSFLAGPFSWEITSPVYAKNLSWEKASLPDVWTHWTHSWFEEQRVYSEPLPIDWAPHPDSKGQPWHTLKKAHSCCLCLLVTTRREEGVCRNRLTSVPSIFFFSLSSVFTMTMWRLIEIQEIGSCARAHTHTRHTQKYAARNISDSYKERLVFISPLFKACRKIMRSVPCKSTRQGSLMHTHVLVFLSSEGPSTAMLRYPANLPNSYQHV